MRNIFIFIFCLTSSLSWCQDKELILNVYYQTLSRTSEEDVKPYQAVKILQIKGDESVFFYKTDTIEFMGVPQYISFTPALKKGYPTVDALTVKDVISPLNCYYEEPIPEFDWNLQEGDTTICTYPCKKAETSFRGRTWTVWYTEELPYNNGPWKLGGLPGLILKAIDKKGDYSFTAYKVFTTTGKLHDFSIKGYKKTTAKQYAKDMTFYMKDQYGFYEYVTGHKHGTYSIDGKTYVPPSNTACLMEYFNEK